MVFVLLRDLHLISRLTDVYTVLSVFISNPKYKSWSYAFRCVQQFFSLVFLVGLDFPRASNTKSSTRVKNSTLISLLARHLPDLCSRFCFSCHFFSKTTLNNIGDITSLLVLQQQQQRYMYKNIAAVYRMMYVSIFKSIDGRGEKKKPVSEKPP